ncbi:MAG: hypothetical protein IPJ75_13925 [Ignavibacteriales bacterium]|nr:hypothetical protein [Ignavibacteriales bacterium]
MSQHEIPEPRAQIDSLLAQTRQNLLRLTQAADSKAHILIVISAFTLNITATQLDHPLFGYAAFVMLLQAFSTVIFASLSIMPKLIQAKSDENELTEDATLESSFASAFIKYDYKTYEKLMANTLSDAKKTYQVQFREIYDSSMILINKKMRFLRYSFISLLIGTGLALLTVFITIIITKFF